MMNKELKEFLGGAEEVPKELKTKTLDFALLTLNSKWLICKFCFAHFLGGILTLFVCPQFGYGVTSHYFHYIMSFGPIWCGIFCAGVFFIGASLSSMLLLNKVETEWITRKKFSVALSWVTFLFFIGMLLKSVPHEEMHLTAKSYYISWYVSALIITMVAFVDRRTLKKIRVRK
jgi:hypothetical protein